MRICRKCNKDLPPKSFTIDRHNKDGLLRFCRDCLKINYQTVQKPYRAKRREHMRFMAREREERNREKMNDFHLKKLAKFHWYKHKRKISANEIRDLLEQQDKKCFYCKVILTGQNLHIEHYFPKKNDKIVLACADCNRLKWTKTGDDFIVFVKEYASRFL